MNHHHAVQFITFSPPFEWATGLHDDIHNLHHQRASSMDSQNSLYSNLRDDNLLSSSLDSEYSDVNHFTNNVLVSLAVNEKSLSPPETHVLVSPNSVMHPSNVEVHGKIVRQGTKSSHRAPVANNQIHQIDSISKQNLTNEDGISSGGVRGLFSKFNCCRSKDALMILDHQPYQLKQHHMSHHGNTILPETPSTSLSEEEEQQWLAYSMQPIAEDQSLAGGNSVVSMSAPLLTTTSGANAAAFRQGPRHEHRSATTGIHQRQHTQFKATSGKGYGFGKMQTCELSEF
jgi:hypothetical protein